MRILTVFTGGTIACSESGGALSPDSANSALLLRLYREKTGDTETEFTCVQPFSMLSENMTFDRLSELLGRIRSQPLGDYDGVIVAHGTDTLAYTASYLSFGLGMCRPPVVLVSANYPLADSRSNGVNNFCGAMTFLRAKRGEGVFVSYRNSSDSFTTLHRGSELLLQAPYSDSVCSLFDNVYGRVKSDVFLRDPGYKEREMPKPDALKSGDVLWLRAHVGMRFPDDLSGVRAVLFEGYHSGTLPTDHEPMRKFCRLARESGVPVFLTGACEGFAYESKLAYEELNIRVLPPISPVAAYVLLCERTNTNTF